MSDVNLKMLAALQRIGGMTMSMYVSAGEAMSDAKRLANEAIAAAEQAQLVSSPFNDVIAMQRCEVMRDPSNAYMVGLYNGMTMMDANYRDSTEFECLSVQSQSDHIADATEMVQADQVDQSRAGVCHKFNVSRADGRDQLGGDRHGAEYFVLDVTHDKFAKPALAAYAAACRNDYPELADDMVNRYSLAAKK